MIKIKRHPPPSSLTKNWEKWNSEYEKSKTETDKNRIENKYRQKDVKTALSNMFHDKCAYCESEIGIVDYGHIEHFRPKHQFPKRIFLWRNLLLACTKCNSTEFKGKKFPTKLEGGPLINPCIDDPANHFAFQYDPITKEARVIPLTPRGKVTEELLGLNRSKLLATRSDRLRALIYLRIRADYDKEARELILKALNPRSPYLAFINTYIKKLS